MDMTWPNLIPVNKKRERDKPEARATDAETMNRYHGDDLPTAPRASDEDVAATEGLASTMRARWQDLVGQVRRSCMPACLK